MSKSTSAAAAAKLFGTPPKKKAVAPEAESATATTPKAKRAKRAASPKKKATPSKPKNQGNYLGKGLYLSKGRETKKLSVYLEPELAAGLRMAAASGSDPRGADMSEIVEALLRENGYDEWGPPSKG